MTAEQQAWRATGLPKSKAGSAGEKYFKKKSD